MPMSGFRPTSLPARLLKALTLQGTHLVNTGERARTEPALGSRSLCPHPHGSQGAASTEHS